jgi:hypothetical protein
MCGVFLLYVKITKLVLPCYAVANIQSVYSTVNNVRLYEHVRIVKIHHSHVIGVFGSQIAIVVVIIQYMNERTRIVFREVKLKIYYVRNTTIVGFLLWQHVSALL